MNMKKKNTNVKKENKKILKDRIIWSRSCNSWSWNWYSHLMAKGTWDILNDDSMTTPISTNNDTISNDETSVVNEPAYATYDYTEDDYGNITYYVQNPDGIVKKIL